MTLHDRIRFAVEIHLMLAQNATPGPWEWTKHDGRYYIGRADTQPSVAEVAFETDVHHILANDPADAILSAEHALSVLERHAIVHRNINWLELDDGELCEETAEIPVCGRCVPKHSGFRARAEVPEGPCIEVRELATRWRVEVDG